MAKFTFVPLTGHFSDVVQVFGPRYADPRGYFCESFREEDFAGHFPKFVQENHSLSKPNTFRGLHFQLNPKAQGKLVYCVSGEITDYIVDIRKESPTYADFVKISLSGEDQSRFSMVYVPPGFAHGFLVRGHYPAHVVYKVTEYWDPDYERCVRWDDPEIGLGIGDCVLLSDKDRKSPLLSDIGNNFVYGESI